MTTAKKKTSLGSQIIHRLRAFAECLENKEPIGQKFTIRKIMLDLKPTPYDPGLVKETRNLLRVSQAIFACFLGVSIKTVHAWEQGENTPSEMACRFMDEIRRDPTYWNKRLAGAMVAK